MMEHLITLYKGKLYELVFLAFSSVNSADDPARLYFAGEVSDLKKLGIDVIYTFEVTGIEHADIEAHKVLLIEWSSLAALEKFQSTEQWSKTWPANNQYLEEVNTTYFTVEEDAPVPFEEAGLYEFAGFWMNRENAKLMPQYFESMGPVVKKAQPQPMTPLQVVKTSSPFDLKPDRFNLLRWNGGREARAAMFESEEFRENGHLRALALDRILTLMIQPDR